MAIYSRRLLGPDPEDMEFIQRSDQCGLYNKIAITPFGIFEITQGTKYVGDITLNPIRSPNFDSNGKVNIEISYGIDKEHRGAGIMAKAINLALEGIKVIKESHQNIQFVEFDGDTPENHKVFTASAIGTVYADVSSISNYPSLSSSVKAGGKVTKVSSIIKVTFLDPEVPSFPETFISGLMKCSKILYNLGFDNYGGENNRLHSMEEKNKACEAMAELVELVEQIGNDDAKNALESWLKYNVLKRNEESPQHPDMPTHKGYVVPEPYQADGVEKTGDILDSGGW
jgi:hypothetical protein